MNPSLTAEHIYMIWSTSDWILDVRVPDYPQPQPRDTSISQFLECKHYSYKWYRGHKHPDLAHQTSHIRPRTSFSRLLERALTRPERSLTHIARTTSRNLVKGNQRPRPHELTSFSHRFHCQTFSDFKLCQRLGLHGGPKQPSYHCRRQPEQPTKETSHTTLSSFVPPSVPVLPSYSELGIPQLSLPNQRLHASLSSISLSTALSARR